VCWSEREQNLLGTTAEKERGEHCPRISLRICMNNRAVRMTPTSSFTAGVCGVRAVWSKEEWGRETRFRKRDREASAEEKRFRRGKKSTAKREK